MCATMLYLAVAVATAFAAPDLLLLQLQASWAQSPNSTDEGAPSAEAKLVEKATNVDFGVAHYVQTASSNANSGLIVQQSSTFQFGAASSTRSVELGGSDTFYNQQYNHSLNRKEGKQVVPNGKKECKMQHNENRELAMKPACIDDDWGYFVRAELKESHAFDQVKEMTNYQYTHKCDGYFFIACLQRSMFSGATHDVFQNIHDWCLQTDNFIYTMSRANLTKLTYLDADLNYIKSNCEAVGTHEVVARLAQHEETLEGKVNSLRAPLAELQQHLPAKGPRGDKGPASNVVGPQGPQGPRGLDGPTVLGTRGERGERGPIGKPGRDGSEGTDGKDGSDSRNIPNAASCQGSYCTIAGQFCPPNAPGSSGNGQCCDKSTGQWGQPTYKENRYVCQ